MGKEGWTRNRGMKEREKKQRRVEEKETANLEIGKIEKVNNY